MAEIKANFFKILQGYDPKSYYHTRYFLSLLELLTKDYQEVLKSNTNHRSFLFQFLMVLMDKPRCEICNVGINVDLESRQGSHRY